MTSWKFSSLFGRSKERKNGDAAPLVADRVFDALLDAMIVVSPEGAISFANAAACRLFDATTADLAGASLSRFLEDGAWQERLQQVLSNGAPQETQGAAKCRDGRTVPLTLSFTAYRNESDVTIGAVMMLRRSSVARRTLSPVPAAPAAPVAGSLEQSQKLQAVGMLAGGIAHEYNNMMTVILNYCDLLLVRSDLHAHARADIVHIETAAQRVAKLTSQLLAFARKQVLRAEHVDPNQIVRETVDLVTPAFGKSYRLITDLAADISTVRADPGQLEQVITNLLVNARDAMPRGGMINISTANLVLSTPLAHSRGTVPPGEYVVITVEDQGEGMDEAVQKRAFEPFFSTKDVGKGTGLGLSSSYGIVKQSGGFMWIDRSAPGAGTTIKICLARAQVTEKSGPSTPSDPSLELTLPAQRRATILLVDDEAGIRDSLTRTLRRAGHTVIVARDGSDALWAAQQHNGEVDVLLTDVNMPRMDGLTLHKELMQCRPNMKSVFMSGSPVNVDQADATVRKPIAAREIVRVLDSVLLGAEQKKAV